MVIAAKSTASSSSTSSNFVCPAGITDIKDMIDMPECYARNVAPGFPISNLFIGDSTLGCKSDADEQLILHIPFTQFVKIHSIQLTEFNNGSEPESRPTLIKIYANRCNLGFEDVMDVDPTHIVELDGSGSFKEPFPLKFVKFQRVSSLTLFIEDNDGGDVSALGGLKLFGKSVATTNMAEFKANKG